MYCYYCYLSYRLFFKVCNGWNYGKYFLIELSMETTKEIYEAPLCTVIEVDAQEVICTSGTHQGFEEDDYHYGW